MICHLDKHVFRITLIQEMKVHSVVTEAGKVGKGARLVTEAGKVGKGARLYFQ